MKVSDAQLRMVEKELHRMGELSRALASDASFLVFTLLMACSTSREGQELDLCVPASSVDALRAVLPALTGEDGEDLDDEEIVRFLLDETSSRANLERAAGALARATPDRSPSG